MQNSSNKISGDGSIHFNSTIGGNQTNNGSQNENKPTQQEIKEKYFQEDPCPQQSEIEDYFYSCRNGETEKERKYCRQQLAKGELLKDKQTKQDFSLVIFSENYMSQPPTVSYVMLQLRKIETKEGDYLILIRRGELFYSQKSSVRLYWHEDRADAEKSFKKWQNRFVQEKRLLEAKGVLMIVKETTGEFMITEKNQGNEDEEEDMNSGGYRKFFWGRENLES